MTSKEKLIEKLELTEDDFKPKEVTEKDRLDALEAAMLDLILGGDLVV